MPAPTRPAAAEQAPVWYGWALGLGLVDAGASAAGIHHPSGEANLLLAALMARVGVAPALVLRAVVALVLLTALLALAERTALAVRALALSTAVHAGVVAWHLAGRLAWG